MSYKTAKLELIELNVNDLHPCVKCGRLATPDIFNPAPFCNACFLDDLTEWFNKQGLTFNKYSNTVKVK